MKLLILLAVLISIPLVSAGEFSLEPEFFEYIVTEEQSFDPEISIINHDDYTKTFVISYSTNLLNVAPFAFEVPGQSKRDVILGLSTLGMDPGLNEASIIVSHGKSKKAIPLRVRVQEAEKESVSNPMLIPFIILLFLIGIEAFYLHDLWRREKNLEKRVRRKSNR